MLNLYQDNIQVPKKLQKIYKELEISPTNLLKQYILNIIYGKINKYEAESFTFKKKYNCSFNEFKKKVENMENKECFEWEDDLMDWEFAYKNMKYWKSKIKKINK